MNKFIPRPYFFSKVLSKTPLNVVNLNNLQAVSYTSVFFSLIHRLTVRGA